MNHPYKSQLASNLKQYYLKPDWTLQTNFDQDEILIIIPAHQDIQTCYDNLYPDLGKLPEIPYPKERALM